MVRHIVAWSFKPGFSEQEKKEYAQRIKSELESLRNIIPGIVEIKVYTELLPSGNRDAVLNSLFESEQALADYQIHPEHKKTSAFVGTVMENRVCLDYTE